MITMTIDQVLSQLAKKGINQDEINNVFDLLDNIGLENINGDTVLDEKTLKKLSFNFNVNLLENDKPKKVKRKASVPESEPLTLSLHVAEAPKSPVELVKDEDEAQPQFNDDCELLNVHSSYLNLSDVYVTRIKAMMLLMAYDLTQTTDDYAHNQNRFIEYFDAECQSKSLTYQEDYAQQIVDGVLTYLKKINTIIAFNLKNYTFDRLNSVDRAIIRIAVWEMAYNKTPKTIAIDTALNITKEYSDIDDKQFKFTNRLLDNIAHFLEETHYGH